MSDEPLERSESFPAGETARLKLSNIRGRVEIRAGPPGAISVSALQRDPHLAATTRVEMTQEPDGTVVVATHGPHERGWLGLRDHRRVGRVDYTVRVPPACALELDVVECDSHVAGLSGELHLRTVSGRLHLADLAGTLRVHAVSGEVYGERIAAPGGLRVNTVSGSVTLAHADLPAISANTVSGHLNFQTRLGAGPYDFHSVSGHVRLSVPAGTRCAAALSSLSGRIRSSLPLATSTEAAAAVRVHSVSGHLYILTDEAAVAEAERPAPAEARRAVLERIARGELSAAEGAAALRAG